MPSVPRGTTGASAAIVFTAIATVSVAARLYTRYVLVKNPGREELAILFAWAFSFVHTALVYVQVTLGLGDRGSNVLAATQPRIYLSFWVSVPMYSIALFLTKVSILLLYLRIFPKKKFVRACWAVIIVMAAFLQWTVFGFMFMCRPVSHFWNRSQPGRCMNPQIVYFTNAPFNILTDLVLFGLPLPLLWGLQLPLRKKIGLIMLFAIASFGCLTSILRLRSLYYLSISTDIIYDNLSIAIWSCVEVNVGIFCACVPTLKPLVAAFLPRLVTLTVNQSRPSRLYISDPQDSQAVLSKRSHSNTTSTTYVQFDKGSDIQAEDGQVKVTRSYELS